MTTAALHTDDDRDDEIDAYWARIAATPWHKRDLLSIEQALTPPVSKWGRTIYYVVAPIVVVAATLSGLALFLLR